MARKDAKHEEKRSMENAEVVYLTGGRWGEPFCVEHMPYDDYMQQEYGRNGKKVPIEFSNPNRTQIHVHAMDLHTEEGGRSVSAHDAGLLHSAIFGGTEMGIRDEAVIVRPEDGIRFAPGRAFTPNLSQERVESKATVLYMGDNPNLTEAEKNRSPFHPAYALTLKECLCRASAQDYSAKFGLESEPVCADDPSIRALMAYHAIETDKERVGIYDPVPNVRAIKIYESDGVYVDMLPEGIPKPPMSQRIYDKILEFGDAVRDLAGIGSRSEKVGDYSEEEAEIEKSWESQPEEARPRLQEAMVVHVVEDDRGEMFGVTATSLSEYETMCSVKPVRYFHPEDAVEKIGMMQKGAEWNDYKGMAQMEIPNAILILPEDEIDLSKWFPEEIEESEETL